MKRDIKDRHFEILGITRVATKAEIKRAFHEQMKLWHPDKFVNRPAEIESAVARSKLINEAYDLLKTYSPSSSAERPAQQPARPGPSTAQDGSRTSFAQVRVQSSNIHSVGYDRDAQILQVEFHNGYIYQYFNVPERVYTDLVSANSKGKYLNKHIAGRYRYKQV